MNTNNESKVAKVLEHPVTSVVLKVGTLAITFTAGMLVGKSRGQKQAMEEAGLPVSK